MGLRDGTELASATIRNRQHIAQACWPAGQLASLQVSLPHITLNMLTCHGTSFPLIKRLDTSPHLPRYLSDRSHDLWAVYIAQLLWSFLVSFPLYATIVLSPKSHTGFLSIRHIHMEIWNRMDTYGHTEIILASGHNTTTQSSYSVSISSDPPNS